MTLAETASYEHNDNEDDDDDDDDIVVENGVCQEDSEEGAKSVKLGLNFSGGVNWCCKQLGKWGTKIKFHRSVAFQFDVRAYSLWF